MWSQYTGHCQVFFIHVNYYMLQYTCLQYTYAHFMHQLLLYLCSFKCTYVRIYYYSFMTNWYVAPWISTLNALENLFDTFMHAGVWIVCTWTCSLYTTLLNPFDIGTVSSVFMNLDSMILLNPAHVLDYYKIRYNLSGNTEEELTVHKEGLRWVGQLLRDHNNDTKRACCISSFLTAPSLSAADAL